MIRFVRALVVAAVACTTLVLSSRPSTAHESICAGLGKLWLNQPFTVVPPGTTSAFVIAFTTGSCVGKPPNMSLSGVITGTCGSAYGVGTTSNGHSFTVDWAGGDLVFDGEVTGTLSVAPASGESCLLGADEFDIAGTLVKSHVDLPANVCTGEFRMTLSSPYFWTPGTSVTASFTIQMETGTCTAKSDLTITGTLTGSCLFVTGSGTASSGQTTSLLGTLISVLGFTGGVEGAVVVADDPLAPGTCVTGGSSRFLLTGVLVKV